MRQQEALEILKSGRSVFLTGQAGSGKTHVLAEFVRFLRRAGKLVGVTASTGVAATHLSGMTLHAWTGMGILEELSKDALKKVLRRRRLRERVREANVLIIDEISMLSAGHLDIAEEIIRTIRSSWQPFGGMQVVLCGDFFQLPPVRRGANTRVREFAYRSRAWRDLDLRVCYLTEQHRQADEEYLSVLRSIRENGADERTKDILQTRFTTEESGKRTKLYTHNADVDAVNERELSSLPGEATVFSMRSSGPVSLVETLHRSCLAPEKLTLKKGALVMFLRNNFEKGYVNGTLGTVEDFSGGEYPLVRTRKGKLIEAIPEEWRVEGEDGKVLATLTQFPLRLAWAITVHKSQGMTLEEAEMDLSRCFEPGMGYVALSRVRALEGIHLRGINDMALRVQEEVVEMDKEFQRLSAQENQSMT